jgi:hypothetical protein
MLFIQNGRVQLFLVGVDDEHHFGTFAHADGKISGTGQRGIAYSGTYERAIDGGLQVDIVAGIPQGTPVTGGLMTEAAQSQSISFHLTPNQIAGLETKSIVLPGFGSADVRFVFE